MDNEDETKEDETIPTPPTRRLRSAKLEAVLAANPIPPVSVRKATRKTTRKRASTTEQQHSFLVRDTWLRNLITHCWSW